MFAEELNMIKNAEDKAAEMKHQARLDAKALTAEAQAEVSRLIDEAFALEKEECNKLIKEGHAIADEEYAKTISDAQTLCKEMAAKAKVNEEAAVKFIAERIVKSSVNN